MSSCSFYKVPVHDSCLDNSLRAPAPSIWDWIFRTMIRLERGAMCPSECSAGINAINQRPEKAVRDGADPCPWLQFPPVLASTLTDVDLCLPNQRTAPQPSWCHSAAICCCFFRLSIFDVRASWTDHQLHRCSSSLFWFRWPNPLYFTKVWTKNSSERLRRYETDHVTLFFWGIVKLNIDNNDYLI